MAVSGVNIQDLAQSNGWDLHPLPIPIPPSPLLERAVGYQRGEEACFLALWWEPCGDEAMVSDGLISFTGHWPGYLTYVQHTSVYPHLAAYNLGSSDFPAEYRLVIDRKARTAFVVPANQAERLLFSQWERDDPPAVPQVLSFEDLEEILKKIAGQWTPLPSSKDILDRMEEDRAAVHALKDWLDYPAD